MKLLRYFAVLATLGFSSQAFATMEEEPLAEHFDEGSGIVVRDMKSLDELGEPVAALKKTDYDGDDRNISYFNGSETPILELLITTPPLSDSSKKPLVIVSIDADITIKNGFGETVLRETVDLNPYRESTVGSMSLRYTGYACLLLSGKIGSIEYDKYCRPETELSITQKEYNYINEKFGSSATSFLVDSKISKVWFSDGSTFDRRRGYTPPSRALTKGHAYIEPISGGEVIPPSQIKSIKDAFSYRAVSLSYKYVDGENYAFVMPAAGLNNHTGKRLTGLEARVTIYSPRGEVVFNRVIRSEVDEENRGSSFNIITQMYFDEITPIVYPAVKLAIENNIAEKMKISDYIKLARLAATKTYRANIEPLGARFEDGTGMGTLRN